MTGPFATSMKDIYLPVMNDKHEQRPCPICAATERAVLLAQRFEPLAGVSLMDGYDVVACAGCGFVFADRIPPKAAFDRYYASASKYEFSHRGGQQQSAEVERLAGLAGWIAGNVPAASRLVDAGCATGELLVQLRQRGFLHLNGLDPSPACVEYARRHHSLRMIQGVLGLKPADEAPFEALVLSAVLEHIPDLGSFIESLCHWLTPRGLLVIEVPDAGRFAQGVNAPYQEFSVEHVNFFSSASLANLLGSSGFAPVATRQLICPIGPGVTGAGLTMLFRRGAEPAAPVRETISETGVRAYLSACRSWVEREQRLVQELVEHQEPILIWGTGTICQRLLATTPLSQANIRAFVDSNPHYQGKQLVGRPILAPAELQSRPEAILISSWMYQKEIEEQIRNVLGLRNRVIKLHDV